MKYIKYFEQDQFNSDRFPKKVSEDKYNYYKKFICGGLVSDDVVEIK